MEWILVALKVVFLFAGAFFERDKQKKEEKKKALQEIKEGFKSKDKDAVHRTIDRIRRRYK